MINFDLICLIALLCLQSRELLNVAPTVLKTRNIYQHVNLQQIVLTTVQLWVFIHMIVGAETSNCPLLAYSMEVIYALTTWLQDFIMLTRIRIFDQQLFKKSMIVFVPLLIARAATNLEVTITARPVAVSPTYCDLGWTPEPTGRQNIVKTVTYFLECSLLIFLVFRHLRSLKSANAASTRFLQKTVAICLLTLVLSTTISIFISTGFQPQRLMIWFGLINVSVSLSDSFLAQSITQAFIEKNASSGTTASGNITGKNQSNVMENAAATKITVEV
ncbi:hypothetical protein BKA69DRAFT_1178525 [Paraphysoderma sedebokerense]|nr:hypothetical protein BKA69DRAFT_1178525 [Paraphysoderma sedebokerense]